MKKQRDYSLWILTGICLVLMAGIAYLLPDAIDQAFQIGVYKP